VKVRKTPVEATLEHQDDFSELPSSERDRLRLSFANLLKVIRLYHTQEDLIFAGARRTQGMECAELRQLPAHAEIVSLRSADGLRITSLFGQALQADGQRALGDEHRPTLLMFYGNGMCLAQSLELFDRLRRLGVNVLIPEYAGYGLSGGRPSERGCYQTADAAYEWLTSEASGLRGPLIAAGASLGGAVAIDLASRRPVRGLIAMITFTSLAEMVRLFYPRFPVRLLLRHRFESERKMRKVKCPTLIAHSTGDGLIPADMAHRLASATAGPVLMHTIPNVTHRMCEILDLAGDSLLARIREFVETIQRQ
jgi:pimeloyl-ACP methyl ester carboxylesterase